MSNEMNVWFRFYFESLNDPKVQNLSASGFRLWVNALCLAGYNGGRIRNLKDFQFGLRFRRKKLAEKAIETLVSAGLFEVNGDGWVPHNWDERQYKSDTSTERVKRFRKRFSNAPETLHETFSEQSRTEKKKISNPKKDPLAQKGFGEFWEAYPKKLAKKDAIKAWGQLKPDIALQEKILDSIAEHKYCSQWLRDSGDGIPYPASFLRGERWNDEITPKQPEQPKLAEDRGIYHTGWSEEEGK